MKRTTTLITLIAVAGTIGLSGCTVKDVDQPSLTGPSTYATSILMSASKTTLTQNGEDSTDIVLTSTSPTGQSQNVTLRVQVFVGDVPMDFGTLSSKTPTTPTTIRYTAPASTSAAQVPTTVTIRATPTSSGDFRGEFSRELDLRIVPQGVILPTNPNLVPAYTFSPASPQVFQVVTFDAATSTNAGAACSTNCTYSWNFGDGTSGSGISTTHIFRTATTVPVTLAITDSRGAQSATTQPITIGHVVQPTGAFTLSPSANLSTNSDILFNASAIQWANRTIAGYEWKFGDGTSGSGMTTSHRYTGAGSFTVTLTLTDTLGATGQISQTVSVTTLGGLTASVTASTSSPRVNQRVVFDASASIPSAGTYIVSYRFIYGDGGEELTNNPIQSHTYTTTGTFTVTVVVTDNNGKTASRSVSVTVGT